MENRKKQSFVRGWLIVIYTFLAFFFVSYLDALCPNVVIQTLAETKGFATSVMLACHGIGTFAGAFLGLFLGMLVSKYGAKKIFIISGLAAAINFLLMGVATTQVWACVHLFINQALTLGYGLLPILTLVARWFPRTKGVIFGIITAGTVGGSTVMMPIANALNARGGLILSNGAIAISMIVFVIIGAFVIADCPQDVGLLPDNRPISPEEEKDLHIDQDYVSPWTMRKVLTNWPVMAMMFAAGFITIGNVGAMSQGIMIMTEYQVSQATALTVLGLSGALAFVGSILSGIIDHKTNSWIATVFIYTISTIGFVLIVFGSPILVVTGMMCVAFVMGAVNNVLPSLIVTKCGSRNFDAIWTVASPLTRILSCLGAIILSISLSVTGFYKAGCIVEMIITAAGLFLVFTCGKTKYIELS